MNEGAVVATFQCKTSETKSAIKSTVLSVQWTSLQAHDCVFCRLELANVPGICRPKMVGEFVAVRRGVSTADLVIQSRRMFRICNFEKHAIFLFSKYRRIASTYDQFRTQI